MQTIKAHRKIIINIISAFIFAFTYIVGQNYITTATATADMGINLLLIKIGFSWIVFFTLLTFLDKVFHMSEGKREEVPTFFNTHLSLNWDRKSILRGACVMLVFWSIVLITFYPAVISYDTYHQIRQFYNEKPLIDPGILKEVFAHYTDHHPIFDTLIYGGFVKMGEVLFHSPAIGLFALALLQAVLTAISCSAIVCYMKKINCSYRFRFLSLLFYVFYPVIGVYACAIMKDTLFTFVFNAFFLLFLECVRTKGAVLQNKKFDIFLAVVLLLMCLIKKTGYYLVLLCVIGLIFKYKKQWKTLLLTGILVPVFVMSFFIPKVVFPALDVIPGGKQETLGVFFQQTARYVNQYGDEVTEEEKEVIGAVLDYDKVVTDYDPSVTDPIKSTYHAEATSDLAAYFKVWFQQGLKHPRTYIDATLCTVAGFFSPGMGNTMYWTNYGEQLDAVAYIPMFEGLRNDIWYYVDWFSNESFLNLFGKIAFFSWWIPLFSATYILKNNRKKLFWLWPIIILTLFLFITPIVFTRYALPQIYVAPLLLAIALYSSKKDLNELNEENS